MKYLLVFLFSVAQVFACDQVFTAKLNADALRLIKNCQKEGEPEQIIKLYQNFKNKKLICEAKREKEIKNVKTFKLCITEKDKEFRYRLANKLTNIARSTLTL